MNMEIRGKFGLIEGAYRKETASPLISKPCEHVSLIKGRAFKKDILVIMHGKANGEPSVTEHLIGSGVDK